MAVFTRADSPWFWLWLEPVGTCPGEKIRTDVRRDAPTAQLRKDNRALAEQLYHVKMADRAKGVIAPEPKPARTFAEQAAWFTTHVLPHRKGKDREGPLIPKLVAVFGPLPLAALTRTLVTERWITPRLTTPTKIAKAHRTAAREVHAGRRTVDREVAVIKTIVQSAVPDYLDASPLYGMPLLGGPTPKRRLLTPDEERRLLPQFAPDDRALFLLGQDSLIRLNDLLDLKRTDDHGKTLWVGDPKSGDGYEVPISSRARRALDAWYRLAPTSDYLFPRRRRAETERDRRNVVAKMLKAACAAVNIPYGRNVGVTFHWATRRTGLTRMLTRGVDLGTAQKIGDWKTADVPLTVYHELVDDVAHAAVNAVGRPFPDRSRTRQKRTKQARSR